MKRLLLILTLSVSAGAIHAQSLLLSDFSNFLPSAYSTSFDGGPWSELTTASGPTAFTIGDFGNGSPSGSLGNGFTQWLGDTPQNWSAYARVELTGFTLPSNHTPSLRFYVEDFDGANSASTAFNLADFSGGLTTVVVPISFTGGVDATRIAFWGFTVSEFGINPPNFGFTFDNLVISAVPEPSAYAAIIGGFALLAAVVYRRFRA